MIKNYILDKDGFILGYCTHPKEDDIFVQLEESCVLGFIKPKYDDKLKKIVEGEIRKKSKK